MAAAAVTGLSIALGVAFFGLAITLAWMSITMRVSPMLTKWIILPIVAYGITIAFNWLQYKQSCKEVDVTRLVVGSLIPIGFILAVQFLTILPFIRQPIEAAVPLIYKMRWAGPIAIAQYLFWAGMFGESVAAGTVSICKPMVLVVPEDVKKAVGK